MKNLMTSVIGQPTPAPLSARTTQRAAKEHAMRSPTRLGIRHGLLAVAATLGAGLTGLTGERAVAQTVEVVDSRPIRNWIVPQQRCYATHTDRLTVGSVEATVTINRQVATTALRITIDNPTARQQEAELLLPVPHGAGVRAFGLEGIDGEPSARLLPREEARKIYEEIVREMRDPGLLEFAGYNLVKSSVFPVEPNASQTVLLTYEHLLEREGDRVDFTLPRSDAIDAADIPWDVSVTIRADEPISTVYSPTHGIVTDRATPEEVVVSLGANAEKTPGAFHISYLVEREGISASIVAYPDLEGGSADSGYFMMLAGLPTRVADADRAPQDRDVIIVIDRSGSMRNTKLDQAREAAIQVLTGLRMGESFNIIDYSDTVAQFAKAPVMKTAESMAEARGYLKGLKAEGGTNIHGALDEAVRQPVTDGTLPMVLFLTDGLATSGNTSEISIRNNTAESNTRKRRIFTFGVGFDVNAPLLDKLAETSRGASINVLPNENIEVAVSTVFRRLAGPILNEPTLTALDERGRTNTRALRDLMPNALPDLFEGGQLVLFGRYHGNAPVRLELAGTYLGEDRTFDFVLDPGNASINNAFVPRLWATRRIAMLIDQVRQDGANGGLEPHEPSPGRQEIVEEIVALSTRFGILTEYTAFLATETQDPRFADAQWSREAVVNACNSSLDERAVQTRAGLGAVNQAMNIKQQQAAAQQSKVNAWYDENMNRVEIRSVCQLHDQTLFKRAGAWIDAKLVDAETNPQGLEPDRVIPFGSDEHFRLARELAVSNRQAAVALVGDIYLRHNGDLLKISAPSTTQTPAAEAQDDPKADEAGYQTDGKPGAQRGVQTDLIPSTDGC